MMTMNLPQKIFRPKVRSHFPLMTNLYPGQSWGWDGINQRVVVIQTKKHASFENDWSPVGKSYLEVF